MDLQEKSALNQFLTVDLTSKSKMVLIFIEPFLEWNKYLYKSLKTRNKDTNLNFYSDIYKKVSNNENSREYLKEKIDLANKLAYGVVKNKYLDTDISQMIPEDFDFDKLI